MLPPGSAVITPNQMYAEMQEIGRKVDHLADIVDPSLARLAADITEVEKQIVAVVAERKTEHAVFDRRIVALEHWRWFVVGAAAGLGSVGGYALTTLLGGGLSG